MNKTVEFISLVTFIIELYDSNFTLLNMKSVNLIQSIESRLNIERIFDMAYSLPIISRLYFLTPQRILLSQFMPTAKGTKIDHPKLQKKLQKTFFIEFL